MKIDGGCHCGEITYGAEVETNQNSGVTHGVNSFVLAHIGDADGALEAYAMALKLSPQHPFLFMYIANAAWAQFSVGRLDEAKTLAETATLRRPNCF